MKVTYLILVAGMLSDLEVQNNTSSLGPYLYGTSINTKGVSNGNGIGASQTTAFSLDDVSESKAYANGDDEVNARTQGQTLWTNVLQGANTNGDAVQTGQGNALADSWSKSFTPTREYYLANYYKYIAFLNSLFQQQGLTEEQKEAAQQELTRAIANYNNPNFYFNGELSFDLQQARASGQNTSASTNSKTFNWGRNDTIQKGTSVGGADNGWASTNNSNWAMSRNNYATTNKNAAAFGNGALSQGTSDLYMKNQQAYTGGNAWGKADGDDGVAYSTINGNNFGYGALQGDSNTYSKDGQTTSVSNLRSVQMQPTLIEGANDELTVQPGTSLRG